MRSLAILGLLAACGSSQPDSPAITIERATPAWGPLVGGTRVVITGSGFDASETRVFVGERRAPLANVIDDATLELVIPPGDRPGDAELLVISDRGSALASGLFRYSTPPAIEAIAPADVVFAQPTTLTVTGSGFAAEDAGDVTVLIDGVAAPDVVVVDDTQLTLIAPGDRALGRPRIDVVNARGIATKERGFRYRPSARSGLLLFPRSGQTFAMFFDPVDRSTVTIPRSGPFTVISAVIVDELDEYWATEGSRLGRIDFATQRVLQTVPLQFRIPAMLRVGADRYAIDRISQRFGTLGVDGVFAPIGDTQLPCCGSYGLAFDGTTMYLASRTGIDKTIATVDRTTGALGTPVTLIGNPGLHVEDMRFFAGTLYATSRDGTLLEIDPATGITTVLLAIPRTTALEVFE